MSQSEPAIEGKPADIAAEEEDDVVGIFEDSLWTIFKHHQPSHGEPGGFFPYKSPYGELSVRITPQTKTTLFAHFQWDSGLLCADMIASGAAPVCGRRVLELGAGTGLPGILSVLGGADMAVLSDYDDPTLIENIAYNVNKCIPEDSQRRTAVVGHIWGRSVQPFQRYSPSFNLILCADVFWMPDQHVNLIKTLTALLDRSDPSARVLVVAGFHTGRLCVARFFHRAREAGLEPDERGIDEQAVDGERRKWQGEVEDMDHATRGSWKVVSWLKWADGQGTRDES